MSFDLDLDQSLEVLALDALGILHTLRGGADDPRLIHDLRNLSHKATMIAAHLQSKKVPPSPPPAVHAEV